MSEVDSQFEIYDLEIVGLNPSTDASSNILNYSKFKLWFTDNMPLDISDFMLLISINNTLARVLIHDDSGYTTSHDGGSNPKFYATFKIVGEPYNDTVQHNSSITVEVKKDLIFMGKWSGEIKIA